MKQRYTTKECLLGYTDESLRAMCKQWALAADTKSTRVRALEKVLSDPLQVRDVLRSLNPDCLRLLNLLAQREFTAAPDLFDVPGLFTFGSPEKPLAKVLQWGLALVCPQGRAGAFSLKQMRWASRDDYPVLRFTAVETVTRELPSPPPVVVDLEPAQEPEDTPREASPKAATSAFLEALRAVDLLGPRVTSGGFIHQRDLARAREMAREAGVTAEATTLALTMSRELGCVAAQDGRLVVTKKAQEWAERTSADQARDLFAVFIACPDLADLEPFFPSIGRQVDSRYGPSSLRRTYHRTLTATVLEGLEAGAWYAVEGVIKAIRKRDRNVLFAKESWRNHLGYGANPTGRWTDEMWLTRERRYFEWLLCSQLRDLGIVHLAQENRLVRVTPLGWYALGVGDPPPKPSTESDAVLVVQPNFEIVADLDQCPVPMRRKLDAFCDRVRAGVVSTYRIGQGSIYRGARSGNSLHEFLGLLGKYSQQGIPINLREQFATWQRQLESIVMHARCTVVECRSDAQAAALAARLPGARRVGKRFILCDTPPDEAATRIDYSQSLAPCLEQGPGLRLRAPWSATHLFVRRQLEEFGKVAYTSSGDLEVELCPEALNRQMDPSSATGQLQDLVIGPLAARYRAVLRAWLDDGVLGQSRSASLVRFRDAESCQAVLETPDTAACIEGRLGSCTVVIRKGHLGRFKELLKEWGIVITASTTEWDDGSIEHSVAQDSGRPKSKAKKRPISSQRFGNHREEERGSEDLPSYSPQIIEEILQDAVTRRRPVLIAYQNAWGAQPTIRRVNPVSIHRGHGGPSLNGYCHHLKGARSFKLSQIRGVRVLDNESF